MTTPKPETVLMKAKVLAFVKENPAATISRICAHIERSRSTAFKLLDDLSADGLVHRRYGPRRPDGGRESHFHEGPKPGTVEEVECDNDAPKHLRVSTWVPNHSRNFFDCFLFGVPAVLAGALA